jgi:hypothetical protein
MDQVRERQKRLLDQQEKMLEDLRRMMGESSEMIRSMHAFIQSQTQFLQRQRESLLILMESLNSKRREDRAAYIVSFSVAMLVIIIAGSIIWPTAEGPLLQAVSGVLALAGVVMTLIAGASRLIYVVVESRKGLTGFDSKSPEPG